MQTVTLCALPSFGAKCDNLKLITQSGNNFGGSVPEYRITSTKSPSFCMTTFSAGLTNFTFILPKSHDCSYDVIRRRLPSSPITRRSTQARLGALFHPFKTPALEGDGWSTPCLDLFTPGKETYYPFYRDLGGS